MEAQKFYDIHFHEMDLSHANITAFLNRFINEKNVFLNPGLIKNKLKENLPRWKMLFLPFISYKLLSNTIFAGIEKYLTEDEFVGKTNKIRNLLSFMESSIQYDFLIVDYFLKNNDPILASKENHFQMGTLAFDKIVLCPLIMDFGYKNINNPNIFYNIPPQKPITSQILDLFNAIGTYYRNEISTWEENGIIKFNIRPIERNDDQKLFEIYPFMGMNTKNYSYDDIKGMLEKYFGEFSKDDTLEARKGKLKSKMGQFKGNLDDAADCKNIFAGIKLYPPLGFEPWPADPGEKKKVELLYSVCVEKNIPVTTHCSTGGFVVEDHSKDNTDPGKQWAEVLKNYSELKINFAHFGSGDNSWQQTIIDHILGVKSNVYTDFSCNTKSDEYYQKLSQTIKQSGHPEKLSDRILFGSDFMINLIWLKSYNEYIQCFGETKHIQDEMKFKFANTNAENFLFG